MIQPPYIKNEENVGRGIASCGIPRNELFITTKVWNTAQRLGDIQGAFERSLDRLKLDYVDLYLIHWPVPGCYLSTWKVLEEIQKSGRALSIGVSNFEIRHLEELEANSGIIPAVNQIECHPLCYPKELIDYCQDKGIQVQAYAPLARGAYLDNDVMCVLGTKYAHTPAQIGLRWATQKGISVIPKSVHPDRIRSNGNIFDFTIEQEDMDLIDTLNEKFPQFTCSRGFKGHCILININRKSILSCNINAKSRCIYITSAFCIIISVHKISCK